MRLEIGVQQTDSYEGAGHGKWVTVRHDLSQTNCSGSPAVPAVRELACVAYVALGTASQR